VWGPTTTAVSTTLDAPRGGLFAVTEVNEWNIRRTRSIDPPVVNVWMTDVYPVVPRSTTYRAMTTVRGEVDANAYWCYGMPPQCSSDDGPGYSYATRPQAGRLVALQARRSSTASWVTVATTYSDIHGRFVLRTRSTGTRQLRTLALPTSAPDKPRASDASPAVTVVSRQTVRSASVSRRHAATGSWITARVGFLATCTSVAVLQRSTARGWRTVIRARLHRGSASASVSVSASASLRVRHGLTTYRWLVHSCTSPQPQHLPVASATSSTLRVRGS
jgi:hypothetical protein